MFFGSVNVEPGGGRGIVGYGLGVELGVQRKGAESGRTRLRVR